MDWQLFAVGLIVAGATCYLVRQTWRSWSGKKAGCSGCGCAQKSSASSGQAGLIPSEQLTLRRADDR